MLRRTVSRLISPFSFYFHQCKTFYPFPFCISYAFLARMMPLLLKTGLILRKVCGQGLSCGKKRPWLSFPMTQDLQNYYIVCFCSDLSNRERIKKIAPKRINLFCWNTPVLILLFVAADFESGLFVPVSCCVFSCPVSDVGLSPAPSLYFLQNKRAAIRSESIRRFYPPLHIVSTLFWIFSV